MTQVQLNRDQLKGEGGKKPKQNKHTRNNSSNKVQSHMSRPRLLRELQTVKSEKPAGLQSVELVENSIFRWVLTLSGPPGTPYEGGTFKVNLTMTTDYPYKAPSLKIVTPIFHPNVKPDDGFLCLGIITEEWNISVPMTKVIFSLWSLIANPDTSVPALNPEAMSLFSSDPAAFKARAKEWTMKRAAK